MSELTPAPLQRITRYLLDDDVVLDIIANRLTHTNKIIELEDRLVSLLVYFIEHAGEVLNKDVLLKNIWQGKVVNEDSLAVAVSYLRKALGDSSRNPRFIKTIQGKGYQYIGRCKPYIEPALRVAQVKQVRPTRYLLLGPILLVILACLIGTYTLSGYNQKPSKSRPLEWQQQYQSALALLKQSTTDSLLQAIKKFRDLSVYGESAPAYLGVAEAKMRLLNEKVTLKENCVELNDLANKALLLEPDLSAAHRLAANLAFWCERNQVDAEQHYRKAIELDPQDDSVKMNYAQLLLAQHRFDESLRLVEQARKLNPVNYSVANVVWIYQMQGRHDLAQRELNRILTTEPDDRYHHISAKRIYEQMGEADIAFSHWMWLMRDAGLSSGNLEAAQEAFAKNGLVGLNQWLLNHKVAMDVGEYSPPLAWARYALVAGDNDTALDYLEAAFQQRQPALLWASVDPAYKPVRDSARFQKLLDQIAKVEPLNGIENVVNKP